MLSIFVILFMPLDIGTSRALVPVLKTTTETPVKTILYAKVLHEKLSGLLTEVIVLDKKTTINKLDSLKKLPII